VNTRNDELFRRAQQHIPAGVNSPVRAFRAVGGTPPFFERALGAHLWDADGKRYIDYLGSWGPMIAGHTRPEVVAAVHAAASRALSFGAPTESEIELAEKSASTSPSIERVRLVSSGTEATMSALRLARGFTGRDVIVKFEGCYHGHADSLLVKAGSGALTFGNPSSAGVPADTAAHTQVLDYNDIAQVNALFDRIGKDIAGVIVEPVAGNMNLVLPRPGFLQALRENCSRHGAVLILDEVMTGFRIGPGRRPGALRDPAGSHDPRQGHRGRAAGRGVRRPARHHGENRTARPGVSSRDTLGQSGCGRRRPRDSRAGRATGIYERLEKTTRALVDGLSAEARRAKVQFSAQSIGSMFGIYFRAAPPATFAEVMQCDREKFNRFFHAMLERGVYLAPSAYEAGFVSAAHGAAEVEETLSAARESFAGL
jgi:glutamate-1-semialdehyde 2,1-aminomutase